MSCSPPLAEAAADAPSELWLGHTAISKECYDTGVLNELMRWWSVDL